MIKQSHQIGKKEGKIRIWIWLTKSELSRGRKHRMVSSSVVYEEDENVEVKRVIEVIQESIEKHFPDAEIIRRKAIRGLFGERK